MNDLHKIARAAYLDGYARPAADYLRKHGNTGRHVGEWASFLGLDPKRFREIIRAIAKLAEHSRSNTKTAGDYDNFIVPLADADKVAQQLIESGLDFQADAETMEGQVYFVFDDKQDLAVAYEIVRQAFKKQIESGKGAWADWKLLETADAMLGRPKSLVAAEAVDETPFRAVAEKLGIKYRGLWSDVPSYRLIHFTEPATRTGIDVPLDEFSEEKVLEYVNAARRRFNLDDIGDKAIKTAAMCECGHPFEIHAHPPDFGCPHEKDGCGCKGATEKKAAVPTLYHGTSSKAHKEIRAAGGVLKAPSYWGTYEIAEYYAEVVAEEDGSEQVIIEMPLNVFDKSALKPDDNSITEPLTFTLGKSEDDLHAEWLAAAGVWQDSLKIYGSVRYDAPISILHAKTVTEKKAFIDEDNPMCICGKPFYDHDERGQIWLDDNTCICNRFMPRNENSEKTAGPFSRAMLPAALMGLGMMAPNTNPHTAPPPQPSVEQTIKEKKIELDELVEAIRRTEGADPELNNPGNLVGFHSGEIMRFPTKEQGEHALKKILKRIADGQNPKFKPDMTLEDAGLVYSNGDHNWAKNVSRILGVDPKTPFAKLIKGMAKVGGAWGERSYDSDAVHDILDSYRTPFFKEMGRGFEEPIPAEKVKALLKRMDKLVDTHYDFDSLERYFGVMVFLATHGIKLDSAHKYVAAEIGREFLRSEAYLNRWKNPLIRKHQIQKELGLFDKRKAASIS